MSNESILIKHFSTPLGIMTAGSTGNGICMLEFGEKDTFKTKQDYQCKKGTNNHIKLLKNQLTEYFNKERTFFDLPLDFIGTNFQIKVWKELLNIPYGSTRTYKEQALAVGNLKAIRAVATANGSNRISIIIPCHRVLGSDGSLTGFNGGLWRKKFLLELENNQLNFFK